MEYIIQNKYKLNFITLKGCAVTWNICTILKHYTMENKQNINGKTLIDFGFTPDSWFKDAMKTVITVLVCSLCFFNCGPAGKCFSCSRDFFFSCCSIVVGHWDKLAARLSQILHQQHHTNEDPYFFLIMEVYC